MGQKLSNIYCLVSKTMTMCESYITKTYLEICRASSCRCIGIAGCLHYNRGSFTRFLGKSFVICQCQVGREHHSFISPKPREWMCIVRMSLLIVTFLSLISRILSLMQTTKEVNPHPCGMCQYVECLFFFFFFVCHLLNVGACIRHIAQEGAVE